MWTPPLSTRCGAVRGLAEHAFFSTSAWPTRPDGYLSALLTRFIHNDDVYRLRGSAGQPLTELPDMVAEAERLPAGGRTQREYYRHIGDFALFWTACTRKRSSACAAACSRMRS